MWGVAPQRVLKYLAFWKGSFYSGIVIPPSVRMSFTVLHISHSMMCTSSITVEDDGFWMHATITIWNLSYIEVSQKKRNTRADQVDRSCCTIPSLLCKLCSWITSAMKGAFVIFLNTSLFRDRKQLFVRTGYFQSTFTFLHSSWAPNFNYYLRLFDFRHVHENKCDAIYSFYKSKMHLTIEGC